MMSSALDALAVREGGSDAETENFELMKSGEGDG